MKKYYLKVYSAIFIFFLINASVQTNVSAINQDDNNEITTLSNENELLKAVDLDLVEEQNSLIVEEESELTEPEEGLAVDLDLVEEQNSLIVEEKSELTEPEEDSIFVENDGSMFEKEELIFSEEETIIIDEEEFSPIPGVPSVKEEVEIEYEERNKKEVKKENKKENKKEAIVIEKEKMPVFEFENKKQVNEITSSLSHQKLEWKVLPQTSGNTSFFSSLGYFMTLVAGGFMVISRK